MCDAAAQAEFMERNCFYCEKLRATITYRQCEANRAKPRISKAIVDKGPFGFTTNKSPDYMPFACEGCKGPEKEEKPMGICRVEGCGKPSVCRDMCMKHYDLARQEQKKAGTWKPKQAGRPGPRKPKAETTVEAPKEEQKAAPTKAAPVLPGDLYIVAKIPIEQIRVMTAEQLREMCRAGHA